MNFDGLRRIKISKVDSAGPNAYIRVAEASWDAQLQLVKLLVKVQNRFYTTNQIGTSSATEE